MPRRPPAVDPLSPAPPAGAVLLPRGPELLHNAELGRRRVKRPRLFSSHGSCRQCRMLVRLSAVCCTGRSCLWDETTSTRDRHGILSMILSEGDRRMGWQPILDLPYSFYENF